MSTINSDDFSPEMTKYLVEVKINYDKANLRSDVKDCMIRNTVIGIKNLEEFVSQFGKENLENEFGMSPYQAFFIQQPDFMKKFGEYFIPKTKFPFPDDVYNELFRIDKVPARWIVVPKAKTDNDHVLLHLHGGGYVGGSVRLPGQCLIPYRVGEASGIKVLMLNYGLGPKRGFPVGLNDTINAYKWLISQGYRSENIIIFGGSAGGGLTIAALLKLRDLDMPLPRAGIGLSPWVDLAFESETYITKKDNDVILTKEGLTECVKLYMKNSGEDPHNPYISPIFADLSGLPPLLIEVGESEVFIGEDTQFAEKAKAAGVDVTLNIYPDMPHVHQSLDLSIPEVKLSIKRIGEFIRTSFNLKNR
ncbi:MAG: alpha/beta hydrolase [Promethearchaeota archaeon]